MLAYNCPQNSSRIPSVGLLHLSSRSNVILGKDPIMTTTPQPPMPTVKPAKTAGLAIAALALGCCSFIPCLGVVCGIIGIIFGIVALSKNLGGKGLAIGGIVTGVVGILLVQVILMTAMILPALGRARGLAKQACCEVNLDGIGKATQIYSANNNDKYPPNLQVLLDENLITPNLLKCLSPDSDRAACW